MSACVYKRQGRGIRKLVISCLRNKWMAPTAIKKYSLSNNVKKCFVNCKSVKNLY